MVQALLIKEIEDLIIDFKSRGSEYYECVDQFEEIKSRIEIGEFHGTVYDLFTERTKGVSFSNIEKKKIIYQIILNKPRRQQLAEHSFCVHKTIKGNAYVLQATLRYGVLLNNTEVEDIHLVISGGGSSNYHEYDCEKFKELFKYF